MPKIKEVHNTEVHWQLAGINVKDAANKRIRLYMGADAVHFAPVYVLHSSYYWSDPDPEGWQPLTGASPEDRAEAEKKIAEMRARAIKNMPSREAIIERLFSVPNDDFILLRRRDGGALELRITGWGFANFNSPKPISGIVRESVDKVNEITVSFSIDGSAVPGREFSYMRGVDWAEDVTDEDGLFSFGGQAAGQQITVRDKKTGIEKTFKVDADTSNLDVDVTEYVRVRVQARHDGVPVIGEAVVGTYGRRKMQLIMEDGTAEQILPWFEGEECTFEFRGQSQHKELSKETANEFIFSTETPRASHTKVVVSVKDHGEPVVGEQVTLVLPDGVVTMVTQSDGIATHEFDIKTSGDVKAQVRKETQTKAAVDGAVEFNFELNTPLPVEFDCYLRAVNNEDKPIGLYPVAIKIGDSAPVSCITDENGLVGPIHVLSGGQMTAYDGNDMSHWETYTLDADKQEYVLRLPYKTIDNTGDVSLRVLLLNKKPAAGVTCILTQGDWRITAHLNSEGMMYFGSNDFDMSKPLKVELYSSNRTFPTMELPLSPQEKEYELEEVSGPQSWWKIAGEIALCAASLLALVSFYFALEGIYSRIPYLFG